jgi:hypothetical protein
MKTRLFPFFCLGVLSGLVSCLAATGGLANAFAARRMLGPETWAHVIRIENAEPTSHCGVVVYAVVFEAAGLLWFYNEAHGTQSLSLRVGDLDREKADISPLLREIEPGFTRWWVMHADKNEEASPALKNACFIESLAAIRTHSPRDATPYLLSWYRSAPNGVVGHTVLVYALDGEVEVLDPSVRGRVRRARCSVAQGALRLAQYLYGHEVVDARLIPVFPAEWRSLPPG